MECGDRPGGHVLLARRKRRAIGSRRHCPLRIGDEYRGGERELDWRHFTFANQSGRDSGLSWEVMGRKLANAGAMSHLHSLREYCV